MQTFRRRPIKEKLVIIIMMTTAAALLSAGLAIVITDSVLFRDYLKRDLSTMVRIVGDTSTAVLDFDDSAAAAQTLNAFRERPHVVGACMYRRDGTVLAQYSRRGRFQCPAPSATDAVQFSREGMSIGQAVLLNGRAVGSISLLYDLDELSERVRLYGGVVALVLFGASLLAFLLSSRLRSVISEPISHLVRAAEAVSGTADYGIRAQKMSEDELGTLVDRFNEMLLGVQTRDNDLKTALRAVERERERFHFMAESMPQKIFTAKPTGEIDYFNRQWIEFVGDWPESGRLDWADFVHPEDLEINLANWRRSIAGGAPFLCEHRFRRSDGKYRWHLSRAQAMRDETGAINTWIGSSTDIHEQKEKEEELRRANEDLRQFAYSASHDLQEPIRNVAVFSEILAKRYQADLDDDGREFLGILAEGGRRLARLVNDLLAYTLASMAEVSEAPADANAILKKTIADLAEAIRESGAQITQDPLPAVSMGDSHLQQVLQNLIGNALKYRRDAAPCVHISAQQRGDLWCFSIRDNGIGLDPQYKEKIFGLFKRLNHDRKYGGTGIGLAICQRVVERYGGRIWVESQPGYGATFFFTVPGVQAHVIAKTHTADR